MAKIVDSEDQRHEHWAKSEDENMNSQLRKATGSHFTPPLLAHFVASQIVGAIGKTQHKTLRILDPAVGDGELLEALLGLLVPLGSALVVYGYDTNPEAVRNAKNRLQKQFSRVEFHLEVQDFADLLSNRSTLFGRGVEDFHIIISNPPYVRTQVMGAKAAQSLAGQFGLSGRVDLYYVFIKGMGEMLHPEGVVGLICSNRFMTIKSGVEVRRCILEKFDILHVWDLGDTKLFAAAVLPAVLLLQRKGSKPQKLPGFSAIYTTTESANVHAENFVEALKHEGVVAVNGVRFLVRRGALDIGENSQSVWRIKTDCSDKWLSTVEANTFCTFRDLGKIRVGVKTTADSVFIRRNWQDLPHNQQPELLRPLLTHFVARRYKSEPVQEKILYPHEVVKGKRKPVDLSTYPKSKRYLEEHREKLEARKYVIAAGRKWYEIWVPQDPQLWTRPKLVCSDISEKPTFWLDLDGAVVNGDCYWLVLEDEGASQDLLWLALAVANSKFIEEFYDHKFHNKLYSGRRRFMSQYVEKFPIPDPRLPESIELVELAKSFHAQSLRTAAQEANVEQLVKRAFGLVSEKRHRRLNNVKESSRQRNLQFLV
jgi:adenine-specific DNA-methyltransferase